MFSLGLEKSYKLVLFVLKLDLPCECVPFLLPLTGKYEEMRLCSRNWWWPIHPQSASPWDNLVENSKDHACPWPTDLWEEKTQMKWLLYKTCKFGLSLLLSPKFDHVIIKEDINIKYANFSILWELFLSFLFSPENKAFRDLYRDKRQVHFWRLNSGSAAH